MLKPQLNQSHSVYNLLPLHKPFTGATNHSASSAYSRILRQPTSTKKSNATRARSTSGGIIKAISTPLITKATTIVKSVITIQPNISAALADGSVGAIPGDISNLLGQPFMLEIVSNDLDSNGNQKTVKGYARYVGLDFNIRLYTYKCDFDVPEDFGEIGAVLVENRYSRKMFFKSIVLNNGVTFTCESWVHSKYDNPENRIFFANKASTPSSIMLPRVDFHDCGPTYPLTETRTTSEFYVPIDEDFSQIKEAAFAARNLFAVLHSVIPTLDAVLSDKDKGFPLFTSIDLLYNQGVNVPPPGNGIIDALPRLVKRAIDTAKTVIQFETPEAMDRDTFSWFRDEEFCRQMLAGLNPCTIQLVTDWPLVSKLDSQVYGPPESAITKEIVEEEIRGFMTLEEALAQKKLFMLDYHDLLLPYVNKVREIEGTTLYGSRTLMFLTPAGTLRPLAIELTRPPSDGKPQWKHVYTPAWDATGAWLWKLAKAHVLSHDSAYHQLVSHWLRSHCVTEPYIIATNRHLSQMHPIQQLLKPHLRYTMQINALGRKSLINAGGVMESVFAPEKYSLQLCSDAYDQLWRFDHEALPADLISRGLAVEDQNAPHGVKLAIVDYPFANDGLLIWDAIKQWATTYINHYYPLENLVETDEELQAWWNEIRTVGHADKKDEPWWPQLKTKEDLIQIVSTIMWMTSGHHAAVNFGQYDFGGFFPNRPSTARTKMPNEDPTDEEWQSFMKRPEDALLKCFPSQIQATKVMSIMDVLSSHSPDEEYIGGKIESAWEADPTIKAAFEEFHGRLNELEGIIDSRNNDPNLKNRSGAGLVPYQLFKPYSEKGVTGRGVPNSISI
ncbi:lipoxygenase [Artemisia annua]|uniref:Lipoxygenase n=1 Tax=Artemisia annua TaxID=35608 RepID=A0A2U1KAS3_ARTAN|nr:lipoxygenase [Artemisia annua]